MPGCFSRFRSFSCCWRRGWRCCSGRGLGRRCRLAGKILLCAGTALFLLLSVFGGGLLKTLTSQYVPLDPETVPAEACTVVVAGSGFGMAESVPPELWFNDGMLLRLHEAGRIARALARRGIDCAVAVSMVGEDGTEPKRRALEAFLGAYGVPPERIGLIEDALNSRQEVIAFSKLPGRKILVSEAFHIPRLMMLSRRYGLDALPAPASQGGRARRRGAVRHPLRRTFYGRGTRRLRISRHARVSALLSSILLPGRFQDGLGKPLF
ncbi:MAG: ElyC/SanA/YdcF family protein [Victivallis sp.]